MPAAADATIFSIFYDSQKTGFARCSYYYYQGTYCTCRDRNGAYNILSRCDNSNVVISTRVSARVNSIIKLKFKRLCANKFSATPYSLLTPPRSFGNKKPSTYTGFRSIGWITIVSHRSTLLLVDVHVKQFCQNVFFISTFRNSY